MEVLSRAIGSMVKLAVSACSGRQPVKSSMVFGSKIDQLTCAYFDRVMDKIYLLNRLLLEWAVWTQTLQTRKKNRMAKVSKCGATAATTSATLWKE